MSVEWTSNNGYICFSYIFLLVTYLFAYLLSHATVFMVNEDKQCKI